MSGSRAPFRADHVGSLLRPVPLAAARDAEGAATVTEAGFVATPTLKAVEAAAIAEVVRFQESLGLASVTDGEYRRSFWHYDFMGALTGLELVEREHHGAARFP